MVQIDPRRRRVRWIELVEQKYPHKSKSALFGRQLSRLHLDSTIQQPGQLGHLAVAQHDAVEAFAYTRLSATVSAAMRLMPIGQTEAHTLLARALDRVPRLVAALVARDADAAAFTPQLDIALMTHQYLHARLFLT